ARWFGGGFMFVGPQRQVAWRRISYQAWQQEVSGQKSYGRRKSARTDPRLLISCAFEPALAHNPRRAETSPTAPEPVLLLPRGALEAEQQAFGLLPHIRPGAIAWHDGRLRGESLKAQCTKGTGPACPTWAC